jgi:hypothetical protein
MKAAEIKKLTALAAAWENWTPATEGAEVGMSLCAVSLLHALSEMQAQTDAERYASRVLGGRKGGQTSKRPQMYPMALLEPYVGMSTLEQVAALGVSMATITKIRKQRRAAGLEN